MNGHFEKTSPPTERGPAVYFGYCTRTGDYRMMDVAEYLASLQQGASRWTSGVMSLYGDLGRGTSQTPRHEDGVKVRKSRCAHECECHCTCCVCDADVLVYARCGEVRRVPVTFENETRRQREVSLDLGKFVSAGGHDLGWKTELSPQTFTLKPCDEQTVVLRVEVSCEPFSPPTRTRAGATESTDREELPRLNTLDRCEVAYATLRAEGCLVRPIVIAIAVLPDDCDAYRGSCSCGCC